MKTNENINTGRAALYCRVASGAVEDAETIKWQEEKLRGFAENMGYSEYFVYLDNGANGRSIDRPGFNALMTDIPSDKIDTVIVRDISRIARNQALVMEVIDTLEQYGVKLVSLQEGELTPSLDDWMAHVLAGHTLK